MHLQVCKKFVIRVFFSFAATTFKSLFLCGLIVYWSIFLMKTLATLHGVPV